MNFKVDLDITPEEIRRLMGLPDIQAFQEDLLARIRQQMDAGAEGYDPQSLMRPFVTQAAASMDVFQKMLGTMLSASTRRTDNS